MKLSPLAEDLVHASLGMAALIALLSLIYWVFTGLSPWPEVIILQAVGFGSGLGVLTLTSPHRRS